MEPPKLAANGRVLCDPQDTDTSEEVRRRQRETWLKENREAIEAYNELVSRQGVFSSGLRGF